jgi:hypothetical protein
MRIDWRDDAHLLSDGGWTCGNWLVTSIRRQIWYGRRYCSFLRGWLPQFPDYDIVCCDENTCLKQHTHEAGPVLEIFPPSNFGRLMEVADWAIPRPA